MLKVTQLQFDKMADIRRHEAIRRTIIFAKEEFPTECATLPEDQLHSFVERSIVAAEEFGLECERDWLSYVYATFTFGENFEMKPKYGWAGDILFQPNPVGSEIADKLWEAIVDHLEEEAF